MILQFLLKKSSKRLSFLNFFCRANFKNSREYQEIDQNLKAKPYSFLTYQCRPQAIDIDLENLNLKYFQDTENFYKVPRLCHGLNKFINSGLVEHDNGVGTIPQNVSDEVQSQLNQYRSPRNDKNLVNLAKKKGCKYLSSSSNITGPLCQLYYALSMFRYPNFEKLGHEILSGSRIHMQSYRKPITYILSQIQNNLYAIQSDKNFIGEIKSVLSKFGTIAQYFFTHEKNDIKKIEENVIIAQAQNYYRYSIVNDNMILRSQIDCYDYDAQGKRFVFQIKTRASAPIRYDLPNYLDYMDYPIHSKHGSTQSFEREYFDLVRGGFIKYGFQLKIGRMDGAFIAYHNTKNIYGYEYIKYQQILARVFINEFNFDSMFLIMTKLLNEINQYIINDLKPLYCTSQLKIGFSANYCNKSIITTVEVMDKIKQYKQLYIPHSNAFIEVINNVEINPNIFRYQFRFYTFLNGVLFKDSNNYFQPNDQIQIKMHAEKHGKLSKSQYLGFLQEAYKIESFLGNYKYSGHWGKNSKSL